MAVRYLFIARVVNCQ